ncbi:MAG: flippase [Elusimicrobia bacterium]|nr:flippase [Elusimicrobiota bacterium]
MAQPPLFNFTALLFGRVTDNILTIIFYACLARFLNPEMFGLYSLAISIAVFFRVVADFGFSLVTIREIALARENTMEFAGKMVVARIISSILILLLFWSYLRLFSLDKLTNEVFLLLMVTFILLLISDVYLDVLRAHEDMSWVVWAALGQKVLLLGIGLYGLWQGYGLPWVVWSQLFIAILNLGFCAKVVQQLKGKFRYALDLKFMDAIIRKAWPFALANILGVLNFRLGIYLLSFLKSKAAVGYFSAPQRLVEALFFIPIAIGAAALPNFVRLHKYSPLRLAAGTGAIFKILMIILFPLVLGTALFTRPLILLFYGENYIPSIMMLKILIWFGLLAYLNCFFVVILQAINAERLVLLLMGLEIIIHTALGIKLITWWGGIGAAVAAIMTESFIFIILIMILAGKLVMAHGLYRLWKALGIIAALIAISALLPTQNVLWPIFINVSGYYIILKRINPFTKEEVSWLRSVYQSNLPAKDGGYLR